MRLVFGLTVPKYNFSAHSVIKIEQPIPPHFHQHSDNQTHMKLAYPSLAIPKYPHWERQITIIVYSNGDSSPTAGNR
jgi:hypothetical protein